MFLKSGDVVVSVHLFEISVFGKYFIIFFSCSAPQCMSKESRLCYHAVPRILKTDTTWINETKNEADDIKWADSEVEPNEDYSKKRRLTSTCDENDYTDEFQDSLWSGVINNEQWKPFSDYIFDCRINVNVRQVLNLGEETLN